MTNRFEPVAWEQVLVRHVLPDKREDMNRLSTLLRAPFGSTTIKGGYDRDRDLSSLGPSTGRWMIGARFAKQTWVSLFCGTETGKELFDANTDSRRIEVAWLGCDPQRAGWFFRLNRAGEPIVEFAQAIEAGSAPALRSTITDLGRLGSGATGEQMLEHLCNRFEVVLPTARVCASERGFLVVNVRGKPLKSALRGFLFTMGHAIAAGENPASDALAKAIKRCDADKVRSAIKRGASLTALPEASVSPLLSALYQYDKCDPGCWKACLEVLLESGCPINGTPQGGPPILDCVPEYVPIRAALKMVEFLIAHGADVNAANFRGETALFQSVVDGSLQLVRLLHRHGADPHIKTSEGRSAIEWLRWRSGDLYEPDENARYARILDLLTGSPME